MRTKTLLTSMLVAGIMGASSLAHAANNLGKLNGVFFKERINTTVKKNHAVDYDGDWNVTGFLGQNTKFDSGKDSCVAGLVWHGANTYAYSLISVCKIGQSGAYALADKPRTLYEAPDGSVANDWTWVYLPPQGATKGFYWTNNAGEQFAGYEGTIVLQASFKSDNSLKNVKLIQPADGMIYAGDDAARLYGTAKSGFSLKQVKEDKVDDSAKACILDAAKYWLETGTPSIPGCGVDFP
ncbi:MAG: hypothetical protein ACU83V_08540 [Gammaproteobacteria bacterium]